MTHLSHVKASVFVLPLLAVSFAASALAAGVPKLSIDATSRDLGSIKAGDSVKLHFPFKNTGSAQLEILGVEEDCGCIKTLYPRFVAPGASAAIDGTFHPAPTWTGTMDKKLTLRTNDPAHKLLILTVKAELIPWLKMEPHSPMALLVDHGKTYEKDITLTPREGSKLTVTSAVSDNPIVKPKLTGGEGTYKLHLTIGPVDEPGDFQTTVKLKTTEKAIPEAWFVVAGLVRSGPVVSPRELVVPTTTADPKTELTRFQVFARSGQFKVLGVDTGDPGLTTVIKETTPGSRYEVIVKPARKLKPGLFKTTLKVRTDDKDAPVLSVPFSITIR